MLSNYKLNIFAVVAQLGNISRAAEALYLTQSAVSQHIQSLEKILGVKLFTRSNKGVSLTPAGNKLLKFTDQILKLIAQAEYEITDINIMTEGTLKIGATGNAASYLLPSWVRSFQQNFKNIKVVFNQIFKTLLKNSF